MNSQSPKKLNKKTIPAQRKTTLKWGQDGELSAVDMTRILERLSKPELTECDLACEIDKRKSENETKSNN